MLRIASAAARDVPQAVVEQRMSRQPLTMVSHQSSRALRCTHRAVKMIGPATESVVCLETGRHVAVAGTSVLAGKYLKHASDSAASETTLPLAELTSQSAFGSVTLNEPRILSTSTCSSAQANVCVSGPSSVVTAIRDGKVIFNCRGRATSSDPQSYQLDVVDGDIVVILSTLLDAADGVNYLDSLLNSCASNVSATSSSSGIVVDVENIAEDVLLQFAREIPRTLLVARVGRIESTHAQPPATIMQS